MDPRGRKGNYGRFVVSVVATIFAVGIIAFATDPPSSQVNPQSGFIELTDAAWESSNYNVRHVVNPGNNQPLQVTVLSSNSADDLGARLAIADNGNTWVVWWRDGSTDQVLSRKRTYSGGTWGSETVVSNSGEQSRNPELVYDGTYRWLVYEIVDGGTTSIGVCGGIGDTQPWPGRTIIGSTSYTGDLDTMIHTESGKLWTSWVDSSSNVAWSQYNYSNQTWSTTTTETYGNDSVAAARARIRTAVLGS
jgi:hypothetical protein